MAIWILVKFQILLKMTKCESIKTVTEKTLPSDGQEFVLNFHVSTITLCTRDKISSHLHVHLGIATRGY